jgi:hypothetical protein
MAIMAMTTSNSINVKARRDDGFANIAPENCQQRIASRQLTARNHSIAIKSLTKHLYTIVSWMLLSMMPVAIA